MWLTRIFENSSRRKLIKSLREQGSLVGAREYGGRKIFIYLLKDLFIQVRFRGDDPIEEVEYLQTFSDLNQLNTYLEKEFKAAF